MNNTALSRQQLARQAHSAQVEARRQWHLPVAIRLRAPLLAKQIIEAARVQINLWKDSKLCSHDYIAGWEALLATPLMAAQMRQNSPLWRRYGNTCWPMLRKEIQAALQAAAAISTHNKFIVTRINISYDLDLCDHQLFVLLLFRSRPPNFSR
jgi:hypothetical protein